MRGMILSVVLAGNMLAGCERLPQPISDLFSGLRADQEKKDKRQLRRMRAEIDALVGEAACASADECRYIGLGAKPCGGAWGYLVYSTAQTDEELLSRRVAAHNDFEQEMNRKYGYISDCSLAPVPEPGCRAGRCVNLKRPDVPAAPEAIPLNLVESFDQVGRQDPYTLHQAEIEGDVLKLVVGYSGGCEEHEFGLWATRAFSKSLPPQHPLKLAHEAHGDACEAYIREELHFDLELLREFHAGQEWILVYIDEPEKLIEYVLE